MSSVIFLQLLMTWRPCDRSRTARRRPALAWRGIAAPGGRLAAGSAAVLLPEQSYCRVPSGRTVVSLARTGQMVYVVQQGRHNKFTLNALEGPLHDVK